MPHNNYMNDSAKLPPLNRLMSDIEHPMANMNQMVPNDMGMGNGHSASFGFNPFTHNQYKMQAVMPNMMGSGQVFLSNRPIKVFSIIPQGMSTNAIMMDGSKILLKTAPLQQMIQVPMSMMFQNK
jgi:hypothetical protein